MTFKEILDTLLLDCDEDINDVEMVNRLKNYINRGYRELAKRESMDKSVVKTVDNNYITKPLDLVEVSKVIQDGYAIPYEVRGNKIFVRANSTNDVTLVYSYIPELLKSDTDETETNDINSEFILSYAKYLYYVNDGLLEEASLYKNEYENIRIITDSSRVYKIDNIFYGW